MFKRGVRLLAGSSSFRKTVMSTPVLRDLAGMYVGGEDLPAGLAAVRELNSHGIKGTLNYYGMHTQEAALAEQAADEAIAALRQIPVEALDSHVSVKLTKIGPDLGVDLCRTQLRRILDCAAESGGFVRVDMEESAYLDQSLQLFEEMRRRYGDGTAISTA